MSPAVVASPSSPSSSTGASKPARRTGSAQSRPNVGKRRVPRRRGPRREDQIDSDDEIERETLSDVTDSDEASLSDSDSEVETESESLVLHNGRPHPDTPSTTQSPPPGEGAALNGFSEKKADGGASNGAQPPRSAPAFLSAGVDWSDMVTDSDANGPAELPVIDFANLREHAASEPPHLTKQEDASSSIASHDEKATQEDTSSVQGTDRTLRGGHPGHRGEPPRSARQVYQQRLKNDPSFVPKVGEFWGHDDRLLQKDLRSLSGWWRGRWQGRGRGRGGFVGRGMRGRGGFYGGPITNGGEDEPPQAESSNAVEGPAPSDAVPSVDKAWTHDGFEEMKAREERRRGEKRAAKANIRSAQPNGTVTRGGFVPRGRGMGRNVTSPTPSRSGSAFARLRAHPDRPWFAMKPEHVWTKQFEGFLYSEPSLKPRNGQPGGYRVRLPGKGSEVVRTPAPGKMVDASVELSSQPPSEAMAPTDVGARTVVVKLPKRAESKEIGRTEEPAVQQEPITTVEDLPAEASGTRIPQVQQWNSADAMPANAEHPAIAPQRPAQDTAVETPGLTRNSSLSEKSVVDVPGIADQAEERPLETEKQPPEMVSVVPGPMPPPPIQTSFPPPVQPTPAYASPSYAYPPSLPPGIALNPQGFAYEVATGRAVYLQPTPPPQQMHLYNPRPIPYVSGHMHHHSMSGDFMQGPSTPPIGGMIDPSTGQPFFALPRQSSRVEIRAPSESTNGQLRVKQERRPSTLRSSTVADSTGTTQEQYSGFVPPPVQRYASASEYYPSSNANGVAPQLAYQSGDGAASLSPGSDEPPRVQQQPSMDPSMMGYPPYQQQYYYPEQYYPAYMEMPQQQSGQYDPYNADPRQPPPPVYY